MIEFILSICFVSFGLVIFILGLVMYLKKKSKISKWLETNGTIVDFESKNQDVGYGINVELKSPIVKFQGNIDTVNSSNKIYMAKKYVNYKLGDIVPIIYNPIYNYEYYIKSNKTSIYQREYKLIMIGIIFSIIGLTVPPFIGNMSMYQNLVTRKILILLGFVFLAVSVKINNKN